MAVEVAIKTFKDVRITLSHCRFCYTKQKKKELPGNQRMWPPGRSSDLKKRHKRTRLIDQIRAFNEVRDLNLNKFCRQKTEISFVFVQAKLWFDNSLTRIERDNNQSGLIRKET